MKYLLLCLLTSFTVSTHAIRHVGSGGGHAEDKVLLFYEGLDWWIKGCKNSLTLCAPNSSEDLSYIFSNTSEFLKQNLVISFNAKDKIFKHCDSNHLFISNDTLYVDDKVAKKDNELFHILLNEIMNCLGAQNSIALNFKIQPQYKVITNLNIAMIKGDNYDLIVSDNENQNLTNEILEKINIQSFKIRFYNSSQIVIDSAKGSYILSFNRSGIKVLFSVHSYVDVDL